ncbi:beta/gamma crystallin-related protein [Chitinimonas naiadis]
MNTVLRATLVAISMVVASQAMAEVVFYEREGFGGRTFTTDRQVNNLQQSGFNDRASSAIVLRDNWEVCVDAKFRGDCKVLRPGRYASLDAMGLDNRVSSLRMVNTRRNWDERRYAPEPEPVYDNRRRHNERLYEADVTSVHAVVGPPEQRCWTEREQVEGRRDANVPGALLGAVIGGVLGHQVGGGTGKTVATAGGAVAGAVVGSKVGNNREQGYSQDVQRCTTVANQDRPEYWDVTYHFRGTEHRIQMTSPPGETVTVNRDGEPRA